LSTSDACWCGDARGSQACCGPILNGERQPASATELMRSRYSAFATGAADYLLRTWHPETRPLSLHLDPRQHWLGLKILSAEAGTEQDDEGTVEFVARCKLDGRAERLHEISRFQSTNDGWLYLDGSRGTTDSSRRR